MSEADKSYGLLREVSTIEETRNPAWQRHLPPQAAVDWLREGWHDFMIQPGLSLAYGIVVFLVTAFLWWTLVASGWDFVLLPAIAGYMIVAPILAMGLYEKSRALEEGVWADGEPPAHALDMDGGISQPDRVRIRASSNLNAESLAIFEYQNSF